jgi:hypothetical protein
MVERTKHGCTLFTIPSPSGSEKTGSRQTGFLDNHENRKKQSLQAGENVDKPDGCQANVDMQDDIE